MAGTVVDRIGVRGVYPGEEVGAREAVAEGLALAGGVELMLQDIQTWREIHPSSIVVLTYLVLAVQDRPSDVQVIIEALPVALGNH